MSEQSWPEARSRSAWMSKPGRFGLVVASTAAWMIPWTAFFLDACTRDSGLLAAVGVVLWFFPVAVIPPMLFTSTMDVKVGADGLCFCSGGRDSFVPYDRIREIAADRLRIRVRLDDGTFRDVRLVEQGRHRLLDVDPRETNLFMRLKETFERSRAPRETRPLEEELMQGARTFTEWRAEIERRAHAPEGYRAEPLDRDALLALVDDARADPTARSAAAWLLRRSADHPGERARIAAAAEATAHPRVRVVLHATAAESTTEEAFAEVLSERAARA